MTLFTQRNNIFAVAQAVTAVKTATGTWNNLDDVH
jgi:hypothetical protein